MEVFLYLVSTLMLLPLFPVLHGNNELSENCECDDTTIDESSLRGRFVHNTLHPMQIGTIDDGLQAQYPAWSPETREPTIDSLVISNKHIVDMVHSLTIKFDRVLNADKCNDMQYMRNIMHQLDTINRFIISSGKNTDGIKFPGEKTKSEIRLIEEFTDEIGGMNKRLRNFERIFDEVMTDVRKSIKSLEKVRIHDDTNRQQKIAPNYILNENEIRSSKTNPILSTSNKSKTWFNEDDMVVGNRNPSMSNQKSKSEKKLSGNDVSLPFTPTTNKALPPIASERSYKNLRKNPSGVLFKPNKSNCHELKIRRNGIYKFSSQDEVANEAGRFFYERYCDFNTDGVAWTVIEQRHAKNRKVSFNRSWLDYKLGFGDLDDEFWFGNDFIHKLTAGEDMELRIVLNGTNGRHEWAEYSTFKIESEANNYKLMIKRDRGSDGIDFLNLNGQQFSTYDRQNDKMSCPSLDGNGWWFKSCTEANWLERNSFKASIMMVRPKAGR